MRLCLRLCVKIWGFTSKLWNGSSLSGVDTSVPRATSGSGVCFMPRTPHRFSVLNSFLVFQDTDSLRFHGLATFYTVELTWELPRDNHCLPQVWHETSFNNRLFIYFSERTGAACFFVSCFRVRGLTVVAQTFFLGRCIFSFLRFFCLGRDRRSNDLWPEFSQASGHVRNTDMQKYSKQWGQYIIIKIMAFICQVNNASGNVTGWRFTERKRRESEGRRQYRGERLSKLRHVIMNVFFGKCEQWKWW